MPSHEAFADVSERDGGSGVRGSPDDLEAMIRLVGGGHGQVVCLFVWLVGWLVGGGDDQVGRSALNGRGVYSPCLAPAW